MAHSGRLAVKSVYPNNFLLKGEDRMSHEQRLIKAKLTTLQLAEELGNIAKACKIAGISRTTFYEIKEAYGRYGKEGLASQPRRRPRMPHEAPQALVDQVLAMTRTYPMYNYNRIADQLQLIGVSISGGGVRKIWERHNLLHRLQRLLWMERLCSEQGLEITESVQKLLKRYQGLIRDPQQHVESFYPGYLLCQDTYFVGCIKGVGRIYMQSVVDSFCSLGFAKLFITKKPMTAVDVLYHSVLPHYEAHGLRVEHVLTDNGREYCGRAAHHPFELFLTANDIEHRNTKIHSPHTNGFCERFHRTVADEFFKIKFREKFYGSLEELQADLDQFIEFYNTKRTHSGYRTKGRTPWQAFQDGLTEKEVVTKVA